MSGLEIIKNIFVNPREAFAQESLDETLAQAFLIFIGLLSIGGIFFFPWFAMRSPAMQESFQKFPWLASPSHMRLFGMGSMVVAIPFFLAEAWLVQYFAQKRGADVSFRSLLSGRLWIGIAMVFPLWLLQGLFPSARWVWFITQPWNLVLMAFCILSLTGLDLKRSAWIEFLALLAMYGGVFCLTFAGCITIFVTTMLRHR